MPEQDKPLRRQVALRKGATESGIVAELLMLLETITADGKIDDNEAAELQTWLDANRDSDLPAIDFLRTMLGQILADGVVTPEERKALHSAVERVLPLELREKAKGRRVANELLEKAKSQEAKSQAREEKATAREERKANRPAFSANFMVAGVLHEGRSATVDQYLQVGQDVVLQRDPGNAHDSNAIEIRIPEGQIGYVPREDASEMAPLLDAGYHATARCTKILNGRMAPIPVVQADLRRSQGMTGAPDQNEMRAPLGRSKAASSGSGCGWIMTLGAIILGAMLVRLLSR